MIATADGLYRSTGGELDRVLDAAVTAVDARAGTIAVAGHGLVWRSDDGGSSWRPAAPLPVPDGARPPITATSTAIAIGAGDQLWSAVCHEWLSFYRVDTGGPPINHGAGMSSCALYRSDGEAWTAEQRHRVHQLAIDGGRVLLASDAGLIDGNRVLLDRPVTCVAIEGGGRVVAGTRSSAFAERGDRFVAVGTTYRDETGITNDSGHFSAMARAPSGRVFFATRGLGLAGVFALDDGRKLRWLGRNRGLLSSPDTGMRSGIEVTALAIDGTGAGWAATARHGLFHRPGLDA